MANRGSNLIQIVCNVIQVVLRLNSVSFQLDGFLLGQIRFSPNDESAGQTDLDNDPALEQFN